MVALLDQHDAFMSFPPPDSEDFQHTWEYAAKTVCPEWQNGILAVDGSIINVYQKPGFHGEVFFDRKSRYSLGCQAIIMPHNLFIVDYTLGHPRSVHDAYAFRATHLYREHATLLPNDHWIWADSAYPLEPWCIPPFKKPRNGRLTNNQRTFNYHLSSVCIFFCCS
ncbi:hypothetical protein BDR06DRAFT_886509 [Suillus hirtellus]|nr:hypothetical protein BDR06DRAFT_886509 [Suillus hirtellus]